MGLVGKLRRFVESEGEGMGIEELGRRLVAKTAALAPCGPAPYRNGQTGVADAGTTPGLGSL